jgi:hypothetical protein
MQVFKCAPFYLAVVLNSHHRVRTKFLPPKVEKKTFRLYDFKIMSVKLLVYTVPVLCKYVFVCLVNVK